MVMACLVCWCLALGRWMLLGCMERQLSSKGSISLLFYLLEVLEILITTCSPPSRR